MRLSEALAAARGAEGGDHLLLLYAWSRLSDEDREAVVAELRDHQAWRAEQDVGRG